MTAAAGQAIAKGNILDFNAGAAAPAPVPRLASIQT